MNERKKQTEIISVEELSDLSLALKDIIIGKGKDSIFYQYRSKEEIGSKLFDAIKNKRKKDIGFYLSDSQKDVGILTQCQAAVTLGTLIEDFNIINDNSEYGNNQETIKIYQDTIRDILMRVKDNTFYKFDASPYQINIFDREYYYVDTMTWVISAFLSAFRLDDNKGIDFTDEECDEMIKVIVFALDYMTSKCYINDDKIKGFNCGWNFTKGAKAPSLYFTFCISECYLDLYNTFKNVIDYNDAVDKKRLGIILTDDFKDALSYNQSKNNFQKESEMFGKINELVGDSKIGLYKKLEKQITSSSQKMWELVKDGIDENFYNNTLSSIVDIDGIESSNLNDALFNSIFVINNIIAGGYDIELNEKIINSKNDDEKEKYQHELDNLLDTLQAALQKVSRTYNNMKKMSMEYIVDDYYVSCTEITEGELLDKAKELRKRRIKIFSLSPLIVKTNSIISEYLVKYPQVDMTKYLDELILKNRQIVDDKYIWLWEKEDYLIVTNYYYILSLSNFYNYYEKYEKPFEKIDTDNNNYKQNIIKEYYAELSMSDKELGTLKNQNKELQKQIEEAETIIRAGSELENIFNKTVDKLVQKKIMEYLNEGLENLITRVEKQMFTKDVLPTDKKLLDNLKALMVVCYQDIIANRLYYSYENDEIGYRCNYKHLKENIIKDNAKIFENEFKDIYMNAKFESATQPYEEKYGDVANRVWKNQNKSGKETL